MTTEYKVLITETITRAIWVTAASPLDAQRIAEEDYIECGEHEITDVSIEVDPTSKRYLCDRERGFESDNEPEE